MTIIFSNEPTSATASKHVWMTTGLLGEDPDPGRCPTLDMEYQVDHQRYSLDWEQRLEIWHSFPMFQM